MLIGYARVSRTDQNLDMQIAALVDAGCDPDNIYSEHVSGAKTHRKEFMNCMRYLREGDTLVIWKIDRLSRSFRELFTITDMLQERKIELMIVTQKIDTNTPMGKFMFNLLGIMAEFERDMIIERTYAGLKVAREKGRIGDAPRKHTQQQIDAALTMKAESNKTHRQVCEIFNMKEPTLHRYAQVERKKMEAIEAKKVKKALKKITRDPIIMDSHENTDLMSSDTR